jgi:hypothetical protein
MSWLFLLKVPVYKLLCFWVIKINQYVVTSSASQSSWSSIMIGFQALRYSINFLGNLCIQTSGQAFIWYLPLLVFQKPMHHGTHMLCTNPACFQQSLPSWGLLSMSVSPFLGSLCNIITGAIARNCHSLSLWHIISIGKTSASQ